MRIKKINEYHSNNPLMEFHDKGYTENLMGLDELTDIIEDSLLDDDVEVQRVINRDSGYDNSDYTKVVACSVTFTIKKNAKTDVSGISFGHPYSNDVHKISEIKKKQELVISEYQNFMNCVNTPILRAEEADFRLCSYSVYSGSTGYGHNHIKYYTIEITYAIG